jgi:uncharacterized Zn finger protein (UPF0148 family)
VGREERAGAVARAVSAGLLAGHTMLGSNCDTCLTAMLQDGAGRVYCAGCEVLDRARREQQQQQAAPMQIDAHEHESAMPETDAQPEAKKPRLDVDGDGSDAGGPGPGPFTEVRRPQCHCLIEIWRWVTAPPMPCLQLREAHAWHAASQACGSAVEALAAQIEDATRVMQDPASSANQRAEIARLVGDCADALARLRCLSLQT